ncbi:tRNA pseudouridine(55) synthase TruB [Trichloromonas sp.]|uniref:tRNA pseudouridine(55) synthase TruB n=1 Tax=Trichloromonas sp. TaxID=3069249 RepID=UPI002A3E200F|nr:tRNA pseudouridine(55) synthase TruB [Trichloromonas sp.]
MDGILVIDKPQGVSSHDIVRQVRRLCRQRQVGHAGTLDPMATGVLLVGVGQGTRIIQFLMDGRKAYRATLKLGESTDTQDAEGRILERRPWWGVSPEGVRRACEALTGTILQTPPMFSALKKEGVPLYKLARQGIEVERAAREVTIHRIDIESIELPLVTLLVECSKGTYIRTLAHDLGEDLGCGAHLTALRRTRSGSFDVRDAIRLEDYRERPEDLPLRPLLESLAEFPRLSLDESAASRLRNGIPPARAEIIDGNLPEEGGRVLLLDHGALRAVARFDPRREREKRGDFELLRVFPANNDTL